MSTGAWLYPHDLADIAGLASLVRAAGLDTVCIATSYHSLVAAVPANRTRRVFTVTRSGTFYRPDARVWEEAAVRPVVSPLVEDAGDAFERGRRFADAAGAAFCAWVVCLHGDDAGWLPAELSIECVTGDRVLGAPCLRATEVQDYAIRLTTEAARAADAVQLESLHWLPAPHAIHGKIAGAAPVLSHLALSVCFCRACRTHAEGMGVDADGVAARLLTAWRDAWDGSAPDDTAAVEGLPAYLAAREATVRELVAEVTGAVTTPVELVAFGDRALTGLDPGGAQTADVRVLAYGTADDVTRALRGLPERGANGTGRHVGLSILPEHTPDMRAAQATVDAAAGAGAASVRFYHLGLAGERRRQWLPELADAWRAAQEATS